MCEQVEWLVKPVEQLASFEVMTKQIYKAEWSGESWMRMSKFLSDKSLIKEQ